MVKVISKQWLFSIKEKSHSSSKEASRTTEMLSIKQTFDVKYLSAHFQALNLIKTANGKYVTVRRSMINVGTFERICYLEDITLIDMCFRRKQLWVYSPVPMLCKAANAGTYVNLSSWHKQVCLPRAWTTLHIHCVAKYLHISTSHDFINQ